MHLLPDASDTGTQFIVYHTVPPEVETALHISLFAHAAYLSCQKSPTRLVPAGEFGYLYATSSTPGGNSPRRGESEATGIVL